MWDHFRRHHVVKYCYDRYVSMLVHYLGGAIQKFVERIARNEPGGKRPKALLHDLGHKTYGPTALLCYLGPEITKGHGQGAH